MIARRKGTTRHSETVTAQAMLDRKSWSPLPAIALLAGNSSFLKGQILNRYTDELFGSDNREIKRYRGPTSDKNLAELPLSKVLDDLRTLSFCSPHRLVVIEGANAFVNAHRDVLHPYVEGGFSGGHLILCIQGNADSRTKFTKAVKAGGLIVQCNRPYDRPPPWETRTPVWESELSYWIQRQAKQKGLSVDTRTAFALHDRVGTDLSTLDDELEKIGTYLADKGSSAITEETIVSVTGDLREDSVFSLVDRLLEGRRREAVASVERLFKHGFHNDRGIVTLDPHAITLTFCSTLIGRLRALRRAHAMAATGASREDWLRNKLVQKPFLSRFQRQLKATNPGRITRLMDRLYKTDREIKRGGDARRLLVLLVAE